MNMKLTPQFLRKKMYHHLVVVGLIWQQTNSNRHCNLLIAWFISEWTDERRFDGRALTGERIFKLLIRWLLDRYINRYADTPTDGHKYLGDGDGSCLFQIRDINIHLLMDRSINWSINGQKKRTEGHISRTCDIRTHWLTDISTETRRHILMDTNQQTDHIYFKSQTSIFNYWLIDRSIDISTDIQNGRRDTSVGHQTPGRITLLIYKRRNGDTYQRKQIDGWAVSI